MREVWGEGTLASAACHGAFYTFEFLDSIRNLRLFRLFML